jgi:hypothetical protein
MESFEKMFSHRDQHLRMWELLGHVTALVSSIWFIGNNEGLTKCGDEAFQSLMIVGITAFFISLSLEVFDGVTETQRKWGARPTPVADVPFGKSTAMGLAVWVVVVAFVNFCITVARLHRSHMKGIQGCQSGANILLALLFLLSMLVMVAYVGSYTSPNTVYRLPDGEQTPCPPLAPF